MTNIYNAIKLQTPSHTALVINERGLLLLIQLSKKDWSKRESGTFIDKENNFLTDLFNLNMVDLDLQEVLPILL